MSCSKWRRGWDFVDSMVAKLIGQVGEFVEGQEEWSQYAERVDHYFVANDVDGAEKKRAVFLSLRSACDAINFYWLAWWLLPSQEKKRTRNWSQL